MQYFATLNNHQQTPFNNKDESVEEFWLSDDLIDPKEPLSANLIIDTQSAEEEVVPLSVPVSLVEPETTTTQQQTKEQPEAYLSSTVIRTKRSIKKGGIGFGILKNRQSQSQLPVIDKPFYNRNQLQLIVSKCRCEFYMIDFDDKLPNSSDELLNDSISTFPNGISNQSNSSTKMNMPYYSTTSLLSNEQTVKTESIFNF